MPAVGGAYAKCTSAALAEVPDKEASLIDKTLVVQTNPISCHEQLLQAARLLAQQKHHALQVGEFLERRADELAARHLSDLEP